MADRSEVGTLSWRLVGVPAAVLAAVVAAAAGPSAAQAATAPAELIVAPTGNDANPGTLARPLRTVQHAIDLAGPGTTISLRAGTYAPTANYQIAKSGTAAAPITLQNYAGERVLLDGEQL